MNVGDLTVEQLICALTGTYALLQLLGNFFKFAKNKLNMYYNSRKKRDKKDESINNHDEAIETLQKGQNLQSIALRTILCNSLNQKYLEYRHLGYIPDSEADEYDSTYYVYRDLGGNHTGESKYKWVVSHLERKIED